MSTQLNYLKKVFFNSSVWLKKHQGINVSFVHTARNIISETLEVNSIDWTEWKINLGFSYVYNSNSKTATLTRHNRQFNTNEHLAVRINEIKANRFVDQSYHKSLPELWENTNDCPKQPMKKCRSYESLKATQHNLETIGSSSHPCSV